VASYAFQSVDPKDKAQCKVQPQAKAQIAQEQAQCLRHASYFRNQPGQYGMAYQQQSSINAYQQQAEPNAQVSQSCVQKIQPAVREAVFDVVKALLKPYFWPIPGQSPEKYANRIAKKVVEKLQQTLSQNDSAQDIQDAVAKATADAISETFHSLPRVLLAPFRRVVKPAVRKAVILALNPVCKVSGCCVPVADRAVSPAGLQQELAFLTADEAEVDSSEYPYIPARDLPLSCLQKLQKSLSTGLSKVAALVLARTDVSQTEKVQIVGEVARQARDDIRRTMGPGGNGQLIQQFLRHIPQAFPQGEDQQTFAEIAKRVIRQTLQQFERKGCKFPVDHNRQY
jgi:hypothetical protein